METVIEKNIKAVVGNKRLASIKNITFTLGPETIYATADGRMKIAVGKGPIISEVTLVNGDTVVKNCFNDVSQVEGAAKSTFQIQAMLRGGLYTLANLEPVLQWQGLMRFGPESYYGVYAQMEGLRVDIFVDSNTFTIKRIVFQGEDPAGEKYETSQDFGPYHAIDGINLPTTWYLSQVGSRGEVYTMENVVFNQPLDDALFTDPTVTVEKAIVSRGSLSGQIVDVSRMRNYLIVYTNWTAKCIEQAGFAVQDRLILDIGNKTMEVVLEEGQPSRSALAAGQPSMFPNSSGPNYVILFSSPEDIDLLESLAPSQTIQIKSKT